MLYKKLLVASLFLGIHNFSHAIGLFDLVPEFKRRSEDIKRILSDGNKEQVEELRKRESEYVGHIILYTNEFDAISENQQFFELLQKGFQEHSDTEKKNVMGLGLIFLEYRNLLKRLNINHQLMVAIDLRLYYFKKLTGQLSLWDRFVWSSALTKCAVVGGTVIVSYIAYKLYLAYFDTNEHGEEYTPQDFYFSSR